MGRVKTFSTVQPTGNCTPADLNAIQDDYEATHSAWRTISQRSVLVTSTGSARFTDDASADPTLNGTGVSPFDYIDLLDAPAPRRVLRLRLKAWTLVGDSAPAGGAINLNVDFAQASSGSSGSAASLIASSTVMPALAMSVSAATANTLTVATSAIVTELSSGDDQVRTGFYLMRRSGSGSISSSTQFIAGVALQASYA